MNQQHLRDIAIIAHVDHGKTTLVDALLKQTKTFANHQKELQQTTILDSNDLERERGVTILAKNTSIFWHDYKVNILDTPGHADFSGEVERVLNMADGAILLVDAAEGVLSQTRFVLHLALELGLKVMVVINKVDRKDQRTKEVENEIADLFLDLATNEDQLDYPVLYARGIEGIVGTKTELDTDHSLKITDSTDVQPLLQAIIDHIPAPQGDPQAPLQLQVNSLDWDPHIGKIAIGRIFQGRIKQGSKVALATSEGKIHYSNVEYLFTHHGLDRETVAEAYTGQIVAVAGLPNPKIGDTITDSANPQPLPPLSISEPTVKMQVSVNTSPFVGREGQFTTSRQIKNRLEKELETNVGLRMEPGSSGESATLIGRGELHLSILVETMRREGYEFSLSRPEVVIKEINGTKHEPWEQIIVEVPEHHTGFVTSSMAQRRGQMINMQPIKSGVRFEFEIATANLIGYRNDLLTNTSGEGVLHSSFLEYRPLVQKEPWHRNGAVIAHQTGTVTAYALEKAQQRSTMMVDPGDEVYAGQVVGLNSRQDDMAMNVTKGKKLTNMRAAAADATIVLAPAWKPSLEQYMNLIAEDEMLEVTPQSVRLRKRDLVKSIRT